MIEREGLGGWEGEDEHIMHLQDRDEIGSAWAFRGGFRMEKV